MKRSIPKSVVAKFESTRRTSQETMIEIRKHAEEEIQNAPMLDTPAPPLPWPTTKQGKRNRSTSQSLPQRATFLCNLPSFRISMWWCSKRPDTASVHCFIPLITNINLPSSNHVSCRQDTDGYDTEEEERCNRLVVLETHSWLLRNLLWDNSSRRERKANSSRRERKASSSSRERKVSVLFIISGDGGEGVGVGGLMDG